MGRANDGHGSDAVMKFDVDGRGYGVGRVVGTCREWFWGEM